MLLSYSVMSHRHYIRTAMEKEGVADLFEQQTTYHLSNRVYPDIQKKAQGDDSNKLRFKIAKQH